MVKNPPANAGDIRDSGSNPGLGRFLEEGTASHSSIMDRGVWQATVRRVAVRHD